MDICVLCAKELDRGSYSTTKIGGVILRPLCLDCRELCDKNPLKIADEHHDLIERLVAERTALMAARTATVDAATTAPRQELQRSPREQMVIKRYHDAYLSSKATVGIGNAVKVIGIVVAVLIAAGAFLLASQLKGDASLPPLVGGIVSAAIVGLVCYALGTLLAAVGQALKAILDTSVNTSTFLNNELRAEIMSV